MTDVADALSPVDPKTVDSEISDAACYHLGVPSFILLIAAREESDAHGICTFTRTGNIIDFWKSSLHRDVSAFVMSAILDGGCHERLRMPRRSVPALARIFVLEPRSGNVGTIDLALANPARVTLAVASQLQLHRSRSNGHNLLRLHS